MSNAKGTKEANEPKSVTSGIMAESETLVMLFGKSAIAEYVTLELSDPQNPEVTGKVQDLFAEYSDILDDMHTAASDPAVKAAYATVRAFETANASRIARKQQIQRMYRPLNDSSNELVQGKLKSFSKKRIQLSKIIGSRKED